MQIALKCFMSPLSLMNMGVKIYWKNNDGPALTYQLGIAWTNI